MELTIESGAMGGARSTERVGGIAGLAFAGGVLLQNGILLQGAPLPGGPLDQVVAFYSSRAMPVSIAVGWVAINIPLLIVFGAAVARRLERSAAAAVWAKAGFGGIVLLCAAFSATTFMQATLAARAAELQTSGHLGLLWDLHNGAFTMSAVALAIVLGAFSAGALTEPLVPRRTAGLGMVGAASLVAAGAQAVGSLSGGPGIFFQLAGFIVWVVWLITASIRFVRG